MLLRFRCKNLASFRDEQEISLVAAKTRAPEHDEVLLDTPIEGVKALRAAAIFGANASGKSKMLSGMQNLSRIVLESWRAWEPKRKIPAWNPFLLDDESRDDPALLEIDFVVGEAIYNYGFEFNEERFTKEWLIDNTNTSKQLFIRNAELSPTEFRFPNRNLPDTAQLQRIVQQTRPNSLFLSAAAQYGYKPLSQIYDWITERFNLTKPGSGRLLSYTAGQCLSAERLDQIRSVLIASGTGVEDIQVDVENLSSEEIELNQAVRDALRSRGLAIPEDIPEPPKDRKRVKMLHRGKDGKLYALPYEVESEGTSAFFELLGPILCELETGSVMLIDELESSLHPLLAQYIVKMFSDPKWNPRGAQLIFATHNPRLLDPDLLRRDQIWLVDKNSEGASEIHSLAEYKPRKGQNREEAYLNGRFGGIPIIDEERIRSAVQPRTDSVSSVVAQSGEA